MADITAGAKVEQFRGAGFGQLSGLVQITKGEKTGVRTDLCPMEFQLDNRVKADPQSLLTCLTHRVLPLFTDRM
jgi:hypothetical protein